MLPKLT